MKYSDSRVVNKRVQRRTEQELDNQNEESIGFESFIDLRPTRSPF